MSKKYKVWIFWALMLIGALLVVSQSSYSDGDDAFFYQYTNSMGFGEYLSWRYQTWVGRMSGEAFVYLAFRLGLGFWRVVNAGAPADGGAALVRKGGRDWCTQ